MTVTVRTLSDRHRFDDGTEGGALFSTDRRYRYALTRGWNFGTERVTWIMLNPSTAGADRDDPTIRKCVGYAKRWGFGGINVLNLFALVSTDPRVLRTAEGYDDLDAVGPDNDRHLLAWLEATEFVPGFRHVPRVVVAWGAQGGRTDRARQVSVMMRTQLEVKPMCLGLTGDPLVAPSCRRYPLHPGRTSYDLTLQEWNG